MAPHGEHRETPRPADPAGPSTLACSGGISGGDVTPVGTGKTGPEPATPAAPFLGDDCWILSGPTAAGKTALSLALARRLDAEIVSVDSMAVYRGLDIGTAKPTAAEQAAVPHHCLDIVAAAEPFSVAQWLAATAEAIDAIRGRGRRILLVGGTPLFLRALRDGLAALPGEDPQVRRQLAEEAARAGSAALHARLAVIDPRAAARIHPNDAKRIIRAMEVAHVSGRPMSDAWRTLGDRAANASVAFTRQMLVVDLPRHVLHGRIDRRVERMFADGLLEETRAALAAGGIGPTARQAAGYEEAIAVIEGRLSLADAIARTQARTRQLAKRQLTWLRSFSHAIWIAA